MLKMDENYIKELISIAEIFEESDKKNLIEAFIKLDHDGEFDEFCKSIHYNILKAVNIIEQLCMINDHHTSVILGNDTRKVLQ